MIHLLPVNDLREHDMDDECWCEPSSEPQTDGSFVMLHYAVHGRDDYEDGRRKAH